jgi:kynurenine formamidase
MSLPDYDDLPIRPGAPPRSAWGVWGDDDVLGCLHLLTPERVVAAARLVEKGAVFPLDLDLALIEPPLFGRAAMEHTVLGRGRDVHDDLVAMNTQASTQWDGFRHVAHPAHGFYAGVADDDHGMQHWAGRGIAGRGVLADVARHRAAQGRLLQPDATDLVTPDDLDATLGAQGVELEPGDVLLVRTGWLQWYRSADGATRAALTQDLRAPGLAQGEDTARWLWDHHVAAVAADNPALEAWPPPAREDFTHLLLLPLLGIPIGELWDLDALAEDCASDGRYTFLLTSAPLHVRGGVASPPNALAIK